MRRVYYKRVVALLIVAGILCGATACSAPTTEPTTAADTPTESGTMLSGTEHEATQATKGASTPTETAPSETTADTLPTETQIVTTAPPETEPVVTYAEVNETVYATGAVNVRSGPGIDHEKVGSLSWGNTIQRIGIGSNGWSKVIYNGQEAYIHSDYLSTKEPVDNGKVSYDGLELAKEALKYLGLEYVYGGNSLTTGADCSGFTKLIYGKFGIDLPRTAAEQAKVGELIPYSEIKPGDLYVTVYTNNSKYTGHAGIYLTNEYISAMPDIGVCITNDLYNDLTVYRIGNNTYEGTQEDARLELLAYATEELGMDLEVSRVTYYPEENACTAFAYAVYTPFPDLFLFATEVDLLNDTQKHPSLIAESKQAYLDNSDSCFRVETDDGACFGYLGGEWRTSSELSAMTKTGEIESYSLDFYGKPWDIASGVTTENGEVVDFSTFPDLCEIHDYETTVIEATCEEDGYVFNECRACGFVDTDHIEGRHIYERTTTDPTCTAAGYTTIMCVNCGRSEKRDYTNAIGHSWGDWNVTEESTYYTLGSQERMCAACGAKETQSVDKTPMTDEIKRQEVLRLVNIEREKVGAVPLTYYSEAQEAADIRAKELTELFDHYRPDGTMCFTVFEQTGVSAGYTTGENIAEGFTEPQSVVQSWMNSPGHKENILNTAYTQLVVGIYDNYWVQLFVG